MTYSYTEAASGNRWRSPRSPLPGQVGGAFRKVRGTAKIGVQVITNKRLIEIQAELRQN